MAYGDIILNVHFFNNFGFVTAFESSSSGLANTQNSGKTKLQQNDSRDDLIIFMKNIKTSSVGLRNLQSKDIYITMLLAVDVSIFTWILFFTTC